MSNNSLDPTNVAIPTHVVADDDDDDITVVMSNTTHSRKEKYAIAATTQAIVIDREVSSNRTKELIDNSKAFADTGATAIFVMENVPVDNKRAAMKPLTINLPDGTKVKSTHECDITIPGLPRVLTGHIVPQLKIASLIGIRVLCEAGCQVIFDKKHCDVLYNGINILRGYKDPGTDLWTLPIINSATTIHTNPPDHTSQHNAMFTHSVNTRANRVKFAHQSLCNPKISKLLRATRKGFLKGCPNITEELILKYLNPSPATAKGCMKRPRYGIKSTTLKIKRLVSPPIPGPSDPRPYVIDDGSEESEMLQPAVPQDHYGPRPNVIDDDSGGPLQTCSVLERLPTRIQESCTMT